MALDSHLADEPVFIDRPSLLPAGCPWYFCPHLFHILQHHIAMSVKGFYSCQKFAIIATGDQHLGVRSNGCLQD